MTPLNFVYWLRGHLELNPEASLSPEQIKIINEHINLVLNPVTESALHELADKLFSDKDKKECFNEKRNRDSVKVFFNPIAATC